MTDEGISEQLILPIVGSIDNDICPPPLEYESSSPTLKRGRETKVRKGMEIGDFPDATAVVPSSILQLQPAASSSSSTASVQEQQNVMMDDNESSDDEAESQNGERKSIKITPSATSSGKVDKVMIFELKRFSRRLF
jgi:hypothetical protein